MSIWWQTAWIVFYLKSRLCLNELIHKNELIHNDSNGFTDSAELIFSVFEVCQKRIQNNCCQFLGTCESCCLYNGNVCWLWRLKGEFYMSWVFSSSFSWPWSCSPTPSNSFSLTCFISWKLSKDTFQFMGIGHGSVFIPHVMLDISHTWCWHFPLIKLWKDFPQFILVFWLIGRQFANVSVFLRSTPTLAPQKHTCL